MPGLRFTSSNTVLFKAYTNLFCSQNFSSPKRVKSKTQIFCLPLCFCFSILLRFTKNRGGLQPSLPLPFYFVSNFAKNRVPPFAESFRRCSLSDSQRSANTCKGLPVLSALIGRKCHLKAELIVVTGRCLASEWARGSREGVSTAESRI